MTRIFLSLLLVLATLAGARAEDKQGLRAVLAVAKDAEPTTTFSPDVAKIYGSISATGSKPVTPFAPSGSLTT